MAEVHPDRIQRELFLAAFGSNAAAPEPWVVDRLALLLEEERSRAGETLFVEGDPPEHYYFLRRGRVELVHPGKPARLCEGPSAFGISDALLDRPRLRSAVAVTEIEAMRVPCEAWIELLEDSFPLARAAVLASARAVAQLEQRLWVAHPIQATARAPLWHGPTFDVIDRLAVLARTPLLRSAGLQTLSDLAAVSDVVAFNHGQPLVERNRAHDRVHLLLEGQVEALRTSPDVRWWGGPGEVVCGTAAFADAARGWDARALSPGHALVFRTAEWLDLMEAHFDMVRGTLGVLALDHEALFERLAG
jgi:CRP-like cAMP-binding protein